MSLPPDAGNVEVHPTKVIAYLLDSAHLRNGGKAAFFVAFGFDPAHWELLRDALRQHPLANEVVSAHSDRRTPPNMSFVVR